LPKLLPFLPLFDEPDAPNGPEVPNEPGPLTPINSPATGESPSARKPTPPAPPDDAARAQALDTRRSLIVEAPAGSGKTGLLIQRYLKLLADDSVTTPEQVLAITFTLKATAEMRDRVLADLTAAHSAQQPATPEPATLFSLAAAAGPTQAAGDSPPPEPDSSSESSSESSFQSSFKSHTRTLAQAVLARDRQLGWDLLDQPQRLNIRTIDSVCAEIARALPVLSGGGGRLVPVQDSDPLHREAARRTLLLLGGADASLDHSLRTLLLHRAGDLSQIETLLAEMLSLRDQWGGLIPLTRAQLDDAFLDQDVLPRLERALDRAICATLSEVEDAFPTHLLADLADLASEMAHAPGYNGAASPIAICRDCDAPPQAVAHHLDRWRSLIHLLLKPSPPRDWRKSVSRNVVKFEIEKRHEAQLKNIIARIARLPNLLDLLCQADSLPPATYPPDQWHVAKALFRVLNHALVELQLVFAERNQCDFAELSLLARHALAQDSGTDDLAAALGSRLQHLLVDEMQDTSTGQYDLLGRLTASWDGHSQTVFLVGDPRQSIYLFRQARVERFVRAMATRRLGDLPLTRLALTANFRSQKSLVDQFNHDFSLIFAGPNQHDAQSPIAASLAYPPAQATLPTSPRSGPPVWHINPVPKPRAPNDAPPNAPTSAQLHQQQATRDAREIRRITREWLAKPLPPGRRAIHGESGELIPEPWRVAVLVRSRTHLTEIVAALRNQDHGLPYRAVEIDTLNERQEVLDLTALTRALLHPADRVAHLAILRAPWCGLTLAELHTLTGGDLPTNNAPSTPTSSPALNQHSIPSLIASRGHLLPDGAIPRLTRVWQVLESLAAQRARLTTAQLVERAWRSLGGDAWLNPAQLTNARRFFSLLDTLETEAPGGRIETAILQHRLGELYAEPEPIPSTTAFVDLLTIHKAKGLEWDVVFLPALERRPAIGRPRLLAWSEIGPPGDSDDHAAHIMLAPIRGAGEESRALNLWLYRMNRARELAEHKRLFYVACTRAREELHLFAAPDLSTNGKVIQGADSLLKAAWPAAQPHIELVLGSAHPPQIENLEDRPAFIAQENDNDGAQDTTAEDDNAATNLSTFIPLPEPLVLDLAAASSGYQATLQRLPPSFDAEARFAAARAQSLTHPAAAPPAAGTDPAAPTNPAAAPFARPEGSFAARSLGNAIHAFLEILANRLASGTAASTLLAELPAWTPRIAAILRAGGLAPNTVQDLTRDTRAALENTLRDPIGLWLLSPHPGAASELALTASTIDAGTPTASIRVDRILRAGPEPLTPGDHVLWIVDYKTAAHSPSGLDGFLAAQRAAYAPQLETYARILTQAAGSPPNPTPITGPTPPPPPAEVRVALYYPAIPKLQWWKPSPP
jgi:ATP-dependent helicase/nuclease subunit A